MRLQFLLSVYNKYFFQTESRMLIIIQDSTNNNTNCYPCVTKNTSHLTLYTMKAVHSRNYDYYVNVLYQNQYIDITAISRIFKAAYSLKCPLLSSRCNNHIVQIYNNVKRANFHQVTIMLTLEIRRLCLRTGLCCPPSLIPVMYCVSVHWYTFHIYKYCKCFKWFSPIYLLIKTILYSKKFRVYVTQRPVLKYTYSSNPLWVVFINSLI